MLKDNSANFFCGCDDVAREQGIAAVKAEFSGASWETIRGEDWLLDKDGTTGRLFQALMTPDMFNQKKFVLFKADGLTEAQLGKALEKLPEILEATLLVSYGELGAAWRKKHQNRGVFHDFRKYYQKDFVNWARTELSNLGRKIDNAALELLFQATGGRKDLAKNELPKLACYTMGKTNVTAEDVSALVIGEVENEWIAGEIAQAFTAGDGETLRELLRKAEGENKEILIYESLREAVRILCHLHYFFESDNALKKRLIELSRSYYKAARAKRFWEFRNLFDEAKSILGDRLASMIDSSPVRSEKQAVHFAAGLERADGKKLLLMHDLVTDYEIRAKNQTGFTSEGQELLVWRLWGILHHP
ncbi:MAG: hypothetical protein PHQ23_11825 [Candidatus Wallbacteria bacterium]|nr:hypothetical protein [Candidatus Wallbacteria bacterium]